MEHENEVKLNRKITSAKQAAKALQANIPAKEISYAIIRKQNPAAVDLSGECLDVHEERLRV